MTDKLRDQILEADRDMLYQIIVSLIDKNAALESEVALILNPKSVNQKLSDYQRLVNQAIDTTSYGHFPAKGVRGLQKMKLKLEELIAAKLFDEALKLSFCILNTIKKTYRKYNQQHAETIEEIKDFVVEQIEQDTFLIKKQIKLRQRMSKEFWGWLV
jgi:hypothetical protein